MSRPPIIRKSDLTPALEAAKKAGWENICITLETADGRRLQVMAGNAPEASNPPMTEFQKWQARRAT